MPSRTELEQEAGKRLVRLYAMFDTIQDRTVMLQKAFPKLIVRTTIPAPYEQVRVIVSRGSMVILDELDDIGVFPTDGLVAQIALVA